MPIREKVRRALRRSAAAPSTSPTPSTSDSGSGSGASSPPTSSRLSARFANLSFGGRRGRGSSADNGKSGAKRGESPDPREKPLTQANMRYQEMFGEYTMTFGASRRLSRDWEAEGVSPMTSRRNSYCWGEETG